MPFRMLLQRTYRPDCTTGDLQVMPHVRFATIERAWADNDPDKDSCIPQAVYRARRFKRPNGDIALILDNPAANVYAHEHEIPAEKRNAGMFCRFLCLVHIANWITDIVGCIGPGLAHGQAVNPKTGAFEHMVRNSGPAMTKLMTILRDAGCFKGDMDPATNIWLDDELEIEILDVRGPQYAEGKLDWAEV